MNSKNNKKIDPKTIFQVLKTEKLGDNQRQILDELYLPVIGKEAYALINQLWRTSDTNHEHFELMSVLQIDGDELYQARLKLEGAGLLSVYLDDNNRYKYLLKMPLTSTSFFNNDMLSQMLLEMVGESKFIQLSQKLLPKQFDLSDFDNLTHDFLSVYNINSQKISDESQLVLQTKNSINALNKNNSEPKANENILDFKLMLDILKNSFVNIDDVKRAKEMFNTTKLLYGINEIEMTKLVEKATNLKNNHFDSQKFKILVSRSQQGANDSHINNVKKREQQNDTSELDAQERELAKIAQATPPLVFLNTIKSEKHGFTTSSEERTVTQLVEHNILPTEVMNILIYLLLVDRGYPTLNKNLLDTIANDWSQNNVDSAVTALIEIKTRDSRISNEKASKKRKKTRKMNVKETLPDWAKNESNKSDDKKISQTQQQRITEKLNSLKNNSGGDK